MKITKSKKNKLKPKDLKQAVFAAVFRLSNKLQAAGDKLSDELTLKQWFLLLLLYKSGEKNLSVNGLAAQMGVTRQSAKKMVDILEKNGYLSTEKSPLDARALCIRPTEKARDFFAHNKQSGTTLLGEVFSGIGEDELSYVLKTLHKMQQNLDKIDAAAQGRKE